MKRKTYVAKEMEDNLIETKRARRKALLRSLYEAVDGREDFAITPMQYIALGSQLGLPQDVTGQTVRFLVTEGALAYKPASEAVALTHKGVVEVERQSDIPDPDSKRNREAQLKGLPDAILNVLREKARKIQVEELKDALPEFDDLSDADWNAIINDLLSDGLINAALVRSGIYGAIGAAYNIEITSRGLVLTPEQKTKTLPMSIKEVVPLRLVTRKGECFEIAFQRREIAGDRDGVFYLFHLQDLSDKQRGQRLVSVFRFGPKDLYAPNYDARLDVVLLNAIRRALDAGILGFDAPHNEHMYKEISLEAEDFKNKKAAGADEIQQLIKHEAYWLGFRHNPNPGHPINFDNPTDLEYLGVTSAEVRRYVVLLGQRGLLEKIMEGVGRPTAKLIDAYESQLRQTSPSLGQTYQSWDVFISHASEDKEAIARPLADALEARELRVWYDDFSLRLGDSLRESIDRGLARSRFGVVILSSHFFEKHWLQQELNGLATREVNGARVILPVWHGVGFPEVSSYSPTLADRKAVQTKDGLLHVVEKIMEAFK